MEALTSSWARMLTKGAKETRAPSHYFYALISQDWASALLNTGPHPQKLVLLSQPRAAIGSTRPPGLGPGVLAVHWLWWLSVLWRAGSPTLERNLRLRGHWVLDSPPLHPSLFFLHRTASHSTPPPDTHTHSTLIHFIAPLRNKVFPNIQDSPTSAPAKGEDETVWDVKQIMDGISTSVKLNNCEVKITT